MWDQLLIAIGNEKEVEAIRLIGQMSPGDFVRDYTKLDWNQSPLHSAASCGLADVVEQLLNKKPDLAGVIDHWGKTALHWAARIESEQITGTLLRLKPDLFGIVDNDGKTALSIAAENGFDQLAGIFPPEMVATMLRLEDKNNDHPQIRVYLEGAITTYDYNIGVNAGNTNAYFKKANVLYALNRPEEAIENYEKALELDAAKYIEQMVLNMSANLVNANINGQAAQHIAALNGYDEMTKIMLNKINPQVINGSDKDGKTMLYRAAELGREKATELLVSKMDVGVIGRTLIKAVKEGNKVAAKTLVEKVTPEILFYQEVDCKTAIHWATKHGHKEIEEILLGKMSTADKIERTVQDLTHNVNVADIAEESPSSADLAGDSTCYPNG